MLSIQQVASTLNLSRTTIRRMCRDGRLPCHRFGRSYRIDEGALAAWIAASAVEPAAEDRSHRVAA